MMRLLMIGLCLFIFTAGDAAAQYVKPSPSKGKVEDYVLQHARNIAGKCGPSFWEEQPCIKALSESNLVLAANYAEKLDTSGKKEASRKIINECAASTAGREIEVPTYAIVSAFTTCSNTIFDVSEETGIKPDLSHYQLLVYPTLCLSKDARCAAFESQMGQYR